jgi:CDP-diacylglycerol--serine O-phosphatidyltransferase
MKSKYRYLVPNLITFASLICGVVSILSSAQGTLVFAGSLIIASYVLDLFDGAAARRLDARSEFGLQLDSLVDMVSLGMAPAALLFAHMQARALPDVFIWPVVVIIPIAGAFRLARFNLLPPKVSGSTASIGLTISTGGATMTLAVLSDLVNDSQFLPDIILLLMPLFVCALMASTIRFPSLSVVFSGKRRSALLITLIGAALIIWPVFQAWFLFNTGYLSVSTARAVYGFRER